MQRRWVFETFSEMSRQTPRLKGAALVAWVCICGGASATDEDIYFSELPVVASVSRLPQRLADSPTAVTVVDRDMIKASGARDLNDVFRLVPGFQTYPNNTEAARVAYHGLSNDDYSPRLQVLVDGRSMHSPLFSSGVNWATMPVALEDIERIEVVRGTNAVSYGSNAFLGVINIITVDPALVRGVSVATGYGNQNVRDYTLRAGGKLGESGDYRFTFRQLNDDGLADKDDWIDSYHSRLFDFRSDFILSPRDTLQVSFGQVEGVTQRGRSGDFINIGGLMINENPFRPMRQTNTFTQLVWRRALSPNSDFQLRYSYAIDRSTDEFNVEFPAPISQVISVNQSGDFGARHELEMLHSFEASVSARIAWGASWRNDAMRSTWSLPEQGTVRRDVGRVFGNLEWKPVNWMTGNLGLAGESDSMAGFHVSPRIGSNFHLNGDNTLRLGYSRANRTPSIFDFRGDQRVFIPSVYRDQLFSGVQDLGSERLDTWEIGFLGDWRSLRASLDVRLFSEKVHNRLFKIDKDYIESDPNVGQSTIPIQDVHIQGVEYQFKWQPLEATRIVLNQAFVHIASDFLDSALAIPNSTLTPLTKRQDVANFTEHSVPSRATSILLMQKLPMGFEFSAAGYWQGKMKWSTNTWSQPYRRYDARLGYPFRTGNLNGEIAYTVQSLNGAHNEYKGNFEPADRVVDRRQWVNLRLDF